MLQSKPLPVLCPPCPSPPSTHSLSLALQVLGLVLGTLRLRLWLGLAWSRGSLAIHVQLRCRTVRCGAGLDCICPSLPLPSTLFSPSQQHCAPQLNFLLPSTVPYSFLVVSFLVFDLPRSPHCCRRQQCCLPVSRDVEPLPAFLITIISTSRASHRRSEIATCSLLITILRCWYCLWACAIRIARHPSQQAKHARPSECVHISVTDAWLPPRLLSAISQSPPSRFFLPSFPSTLLFLPFDASPTRQFLL